MEKVTASTMTDLALNSPPPPLSPISEKSINNKHQEEFAASFASLYDSIFSPESQLPSSLSLSPSPPSSFSPPNRIDESTDHRLRQAQLILEYDELNEHYEFCLNRLQSLVTEIDSLRQENDALRHENSDLLNLIHISTSSSSSSVSPPAIHNRQQISGNKNYRSTRNILPKSISVRSPRYLKIKHGARSHQTSQLGSESVAYQGMIKTELCNKWQETKACPYGDNCQFAHGIEDLRPVIRHPRYKTDVCRMIITGATCPYGHRCHFRHSLTDQERMILLTR